MPTAPDYLHDQMMEWFGNAIGDADPIRFLESHGWTLTNKWQWKPPVPSHTMSCYEEACIDFLITEWDFGDTFEWVGERRCLCAIGRAK